MAFTDLIHGLPLSGAGLYRGSFWGLLAPVAIVGGLASLAMFVVHGATFPAYNRYLRELIHTGKAKPSFVVSHELPLDRAPEGYQHFDARDNGWTKVVLGPRRLIGGTPGQPPPRRAAAVPVPARSS